ncbi:MAG: hypothetical protein LBL59_07525 [Xanthomonadaceae bacterium]|jgi:hypothetical protein|nr:hypothetical protein [Xanthomonadaceae bacterium]
MSLPMALQYVAVAILVLISGWVVLKKQFPNLLRRMRIALAIPMLREGKPVWVRRLGKWIAPVPASGGPGCGGCGGCDSSSHC